MYVELRGKAGRDENDDEDDAPVKSTINDSDQVSDNIVCRNGWYFTGLFAFCMFGPFVPKYDRVNLFETGGTSSDNIIENGQNHVRLQKKMDNEQMNDKINVCGESFDMKLGMAIIEVKQKNIHLQKKERKILGINSQIQLVQKKLEQME